MKSPETERLLGQQGFTSGWGCWQYVPSDQRRLALQLALTGLKSGGKTNIQAVSFTQDQPLPWSTVKIYPGFAEMEKPRSTVEVGGSYVRLSPPCPWQTSTLLLLPLRPPQKGQRNESLRNTLQCPINEHFLDLNVNSHPQLWNAPPLTIPLTKDWFVLL